MLLDENQKDNRTRQVGINNQPYTEEADLDKDNNLARISDNIPVEGTTGGSTVETSKEHDKKLKEKKKNKKNKKK